MPDNPHFQVPFSFGMDSHARVVEQDSQDDIFQCVQAICRTPLGLRLELPTFGIPDPVFDEGGPDTRAIARAIGNWDDRAETVINLSHDDQIDRLMWTIRVGVEGNG